MNQNLVPPTESAQMPQWMAANLGMEKLPEMKVKKPNIGYFEIPVFANTTLDEYRKKVEQHVTREIGLDYEYFTNNYYSRKTDLKISRMLVWYFCKEKFPKVALSRLGGFYNKDHSTVIHGIKTVNNIIKTERVFREMVQKLEAQLE